jgi:hypothetical protein
MNTDRLEALLWARVDGTIDPQELAELEAHLADHPEPREIERQITTIASGLDALDREPPPSELRERIDRALAHAAPPAARTDHSTATPHIRSAPIGPARWLPLAASLVIGIAIGYLVHPSTGGSIDQSEVVGTMLTPPAQTSIAPVIIDFDGGTVTASRVGADVVVDVGLTSVMDLAITVAGAGGPVHFESLRSTEGFATDVTTEQGWIVVRAKGPGTVTFSVSAFDVDDPLRLQVSSDGFPVEERWIGPLQNELEP